MNYQRRSSDREFNLEENFVTSKFCDERDGATKDRMTKLENSVDSIIKTVQKANMQLAAVMGGITLIGVLAGLILQYVAIQHGVKP